MPSLRAESHSGERPPGIFLTMSALLMLTRHDGLAHTTLVAIFIVVLLSSPEGVNNADNGEDEDSDPDYGICFLANRSPQFLQRFGSTIFSSWARVRLNGSGQLFVSASIKVGESVMKRRFFFLVATVI